MIDGETMTIGGDGPQRFPLKINQQALEIVANILLRDGKNGLLERFAKDHRFDAHLEFRHTHIEGRVILNRQGNEIEATPTGSNQKAIITTLETDAAVIRQQSKNIEKPSSRDRHRSLFVHGRNHSRLQLDLLVRPNQLKASLLDRENHVGKDRDNLVFFDDTCHMRQWCEKGLSCNGKFHGGVLRVRLTRAPNT